MSRSTRSLLAALSALTALAPPATVASTDDLLLPQNKQAELLDPTERNPFSRRSTAPAVTLIEEEAETEEGRLRDILESSRVSGYAEAAGIASISLALPALHRDAGSSGRLRPGTASIRIRPGDILPPFLPSQTERIRVVSITQSRADLVFVEAEERPLNRTITLPYDLQPTVRHLLGTQMLPDSSGPVFHGIFPTPAKSADASEP